jgi:hypothetical protein
MKKLIGLDTNFWESNLRHTLDFFRNHNITNKWCQKEFRRLTGIKPKTFQKMFEILAGCR